MKTTNNIMRKIQVILELGCSAPQSWTTTEDHIRRFGVGCSIDLPDVLESGKTYFVGTSTPHRFPSDVILTVEKQPFSAFTGYNKTKND